MPRRPPNVVILAGPNGAGKSTTGPSLVKDTLKIVDLVNADTIARGLSAFDPEGAAIQAGSVMLHRLRELSRRGKDFAFETTMAGRSLAPWLVRLRKQGYRIHIIFLWLPDPVVAIERVIDRVRMGGHNVPEDVVRRRYRSGLWNFFHLYRPLADTWRLYDNSRVTGPRLVASGRRKGRVRIADQTTWKKVQEGVKP